MRFRISILLLIISGLICAQPLQAQQTKSDPHLYTFFFRGIPLGSALNELVTKTNIDLIYDPKLTDGHTVFVKAEQLSAPEILKKVLKSASLDYIQLSSGTFVVTRQSEMPPEYGYFTGIVRDADSGQPLPDANVMLTDASRFTTSNPSGVFHLDDLLPGQYDITVQYLGYKPVNRKLTIPSSGQVTETFELKEKPLVAEPVVVSGLDGQSDIGTGSISIDPNKPEYTTPLLPGPAGPIQSLGGFMGLQFSIPANSLHMQGGYDGDQQIRLDGIPVYSSSSIGTFAGLFSPYAIKKVTVNKAGFDASHGSQIAGVINLEQDGGGKPQVMFQSDPYALNLKMSGKHTFKANKSLSAMVALRSDIWNLVRAPGYRDLFTRWDRLDPLLTNTILQPEQQIVHFNPISEEPTIHFDDLHGSLTYQSGSLSTTSLTVYHGSTRFHTLLYSRSNINGEPDKRYMATKDAYQWENTALQLKQNWISGTRIDLSAGLQYSGHKLAHQYAMAESSQPGFGSYKSSDTLSVLKQIIDSGDAISNENHISRSDLFINVNYFPALNHHVQAGLDFIEMSYRFNLSDIFYIPVLNTHHSNQITAFVQDKITVGTHGRITAGMRFTYIPAVQKVFAEPRLSLALSHFSTPVGKSTINISGGLFRQYVNQFEVTNLGPSAIVPALTFWLPADYTIAVPRAYHIDLQTLTDPGSGWSITTESYLKWQPVGLTLDYSRLLDQSGIATTKSHDQRDFIVSMRTLAVGAGIRVQKKWNAENLKATVGFDYSNTRSKIPGRFNDSWQSVPWNQPYRLSSGLDWLPANKLTVLLRFQGIFGRSWAYSRAYYDFLSYKNIRTLAPDIFSDPSHDRLPLFLQLDAAVAYNGDFTGLKYQLRIDLINMLNRHNVTKWVLNPYNQNNFLTYQRQSQRMPGFTPSVSLQINF